MYLVTDRAERACTTFTRESDVALRFIGAIYEATLGAWHHVTDSLTNQPLATPRRELLIAVPLTFIHDLRVGCR